MVTYKAQKTICAIGIAILSFMAVVILIFGGQNAKTAFAANFENGTADNPITIANVADYNRIVNAINGNDIIPGSTNDKRYSDVGVYYEITSDLDFGNGKTEIINEFKGHIDGKNHKISNIAIPTTQDIGTDYALFRTITVDATVNNILFENISISASHAVKVAMLAINNYGNIDNINARNINISSSKSSVSTHTLSAYAYGFVANNYGKITNVKLEIGKIIASGESGYAHGFAGNAGDVENIELIFNNSTLNASGSYTYASGIPYGFAQTITRGENISIHGTGTIESSQGGASGNFSQIYLFAGSASNINNANLDFSNIKITGNKDITFYGMANATNFTNSKMTYGNINCPNLNNFYGFASGVDGEIRRNTLTVLNPINIAGDNTQFYGFANVISGVVKDNNIFYNNVSFGYDPYYTQTFNGFAGTIKSGSVVENNGINYGDVSMSGGRNSTHYFNGIAQTSSADLSNNVVTVNNFAISSGMTKKIYLTIKDGNAEQHNNYVYVGGSEIGTFAGTTIRNYFSAEITMNNKSDATIKKVYGTSSPSLSDIQINVGDNLLESIEKWVKKNGTFENQYARWGVRDGSFPFLTYENPITELLYNSEILTGSADINNPTFLLLNEDRVYTWVVYDWSTMDITKNGEVMAVNNTDGQYSFECQTDDAVTYLVASGTDQKNYVYWKIVIDKKAPTLSVILNANEIWHGSNNEADSSIETILRNEKLILNATDDSKIVEVLLNGKPYVLGTQISAKLGEYIFKVTDEIGNISFVKLLCEDLPAKIKIDGVEVQGGTKAEPTIITKNNSVILDFALSHKKAMTIKRSGAEDIVFSTDGTHSATLDVLDNEFATFNVTSANAVGDDNLYYRIVIDKVKPELTLYHAGIKVFDGSNGEADEAVLYILAGEKIKIRATDNLAITAKLNGAEYELDTDIISQIGDYKFEVTDEVGNKSYVLITCETLPATLTIGGIEYDGGTEKAPTKLMFGADTEIMFDLLARKKVTITNPDETEVVLSSNGVNIHTLSTAENSVAKFTVCSKNTSGNASIYYEITLDKTKPQLTLFNNGANIFTGSNNDGDDAVKYILSGETIKLSATDENTLTAKLNGTEYKLNTTITVTVGDYKFEVTDEVGNKSYVLITCETLPATLTIGGIEYDGGTEKAPTKLMFGADTEIMFDLLARKKVTITNPDGTEAFLSTEGKNTHTILAISSSVVTYKICSENTSGNASIYYEISLKTTSPTFNRQKLEKWYKQSHFWNTNGTSFGNYELALKEAVNKEQGDFIIEYTLNNISDFTETHLLAEGETIAVGKYYKYKSTRSDQSFVYYFSLENMQKVIEKYAVKNIEEKYISKGSSGAYEKLDESMYDSTLSIDGKTAYFVNGYTFKKENPTDKIEYNRNGEWIEIPTNATFDSIVTVSGLYEIRESDEVSNVTMFYVFVDHDSPKVDYTAHRDDVAGDIKNIISIADIPNGSSLKYFFKDFSFKLIESDGKAIIQLTNSLGNKKFTNVADVILAPGVNDFSIYDRSGNSFAFTIVIAGRTPNVTFSDSASKMTISISKVESYQSIEKIEIYKNGKIVDVDDNGVAIESKTTSYTFTKGGSFEVVIVDNFGRTTSFSNTFDKDLPTAEFIGVTPPGVTNKNVQIKYDSSKYVLTITKDGTQLVYSEKPQGNYSIVTIESTVLNSGEYKVLVTDNADESIGRTYTFTIKRNDMTVSLIGVEQNGTTANDVYLTWSDDKFEAKYTKDKINMGRYVNNQVLTEEGQYVVTVIDEAGNEKVFAFEIRKSMEYEIIVGGQVVQFLSETNRDVQFMSNNPSKMSITLMSTASKTIIPYKWGDVISSEGEYTVGIRDSLGNSKTFTFKIDKTKPIGTLKGVEHKGKTNGEVSFSWNEGTATAVLLKNGQQIGQYVRNKGIDVEGEYKIRLSDKAGNYTEYEFTIDRSVDFSVNVQNGLVSNVPVTISSDEKELTIDLLKDGEVMKYKFNSEIKENGRYSFKILDKFNNYNEYDFIVLTTETSSFSYEIPQDYSWNEIWRDGESVDTANLVKYDFENDGMYTCSVTSKASGQVFNFNVTIDTVPPVVRLIGVENGGSTEEVVRIECDEDVDIVLLRDGKEVKYTVGKEIANDGDFEVLVTDKAGNETEYYFHRIYKMNTAGKVAIGGGGVTILGILEEILRKRRIRIK